MQTQEVICKTCDFWKPRRNGLGYCYRRDWDIDENGTCREWEPKSTQGHKKKRIKYKKGIQNENTRTLL